MEIVGGVEDMLLCWRDTMEGRKRTVKVVPTNDVTKQTYSFIIKKSGGFRKCDGKQYLLEL